MPYYFIVDTDSYSGNFEKELCAYCTGSSRWRGEEEAENFLQTYGEEFVDNFQEILDTFSSSCDDCVGIAPTPGYANNGCGIHYKIGDLDAEKEAKEKAPLSYIRELEQVKKYTHWSKEVQEKEINRLIQKIEEIKNEPLKKYPAYQSVSIKFNELPLKDEINILCSRAKEYLGNNNIKFLGFRMIKESLNYEEINLNELS